MARAHLDVRRCYEQGWASRHVARVTFVRWFWQAVNRLGEWAWQQCWRTVVRGPGPGRSGGIISADGRAQLWGQVLEQRGRGGLERLQGVVEPGGREFFLAGHRGEQTQRPGHLTVQVLGSLEEVP